MAASVAVLTILDVVKVNVVLTPLEETLSATPTQTGLVVAGYVLAFGIALVPSGRLGGPMESQGNVYARIGDLCPCLTWRCVGV